MRRARVTLARWAANVHALLVQLQAGEANGRPIPGDDVEAVQPVGFRSRPVVRESTEALVFELANGQRVAFVVDKGRADGDGVVVPEAGETQVYGAAAPSAVVRIKADGAIEITPAAGKDVVLAGGTKEVARKDDPVSIGRLAFAGSGTLTWTPVGGAPQTITAATEITGAVTDGAPNVKA